MTNPSCYLPKCEDCQVKDSCKNYPWGVGSVWETTSVPPVLTTTNGQDDILWTVWDVLPPSCSYEKIEPPITNYGLDGECSYFSVRDK